MRIIKVFPLIFLVVIFFGCNKQWKQKNITVNGTPTLLKEKRDVHVIFDSSELESWEDVKDVLILEAQKKAILDIAKKWLGESLLLKTTNQRLLPDGEMELNVASKDFDPDFDKETNIYEADFSFECELVPTLDYVGEIIGIEGGYSLATSNVVVELKGIIPKGYTYVAIAKKNDFNLGNYYQITGFGKIYNVMNKVAQCEIISTARETRKGDLVFLLRTKTYGTKKTKLETQNIPTVLVKPIVEKKEEGPKEMK